MSDRSLLISIAPNGARKTKGDHAAIPLAPAELAREALACRIAGAGLIHLHVRDETGGHSLDADRYRAAITAVRAAVGDGMIVQITTESCGLFDVGTQMAVVRDVKPQAASFAVRELIADRDAESAAAPFFSWVRENGIIPQFILYTSDEVDRLRDLIDRSVVPFFNPPVLFVLGRYGDGPPSDPAMIAPFLDRWISGGHWSVCAFGPSEIDVAAAALALGGHIRVGFENNMLRPDGVLLASNAEQVGYVAAIASALKRPLVHQMDSGD